MIGQSVTDALPALKSDIDERYPGDASNPDICPYELTLTPVDPNDANIITIGVAKDPATAKYINTITLDATMNGIPDLGDYAYEITVTPLPLDGRVPVTLPLNVIINPCITSSYDASPTKLSFEYEIGTPGITTPSAFSFEITPNFCVYAATNKIISSSPPLPSYIYLTSADQDTFTIDKLTDNSLKQTYEVTVESTI